MDSFNEASGVDAARKRVAAGAAASAVRSRLRELGDRHRAPPPPPTPRAAEGRRGDVGGGSTARDGGPGKVAGDAGGGRRATSCDVGGGGGGGSAAREAADGARDARRGGGLRKVAEDAGGGASRSGVVVAPAGVAGRASPGDGAHGVAVVAAAPREGRDGGEVRSKRPLSSAASPRAHPPPERRKVQVPASPRSGPGGGRGTDDGGGSLLVAAPARTGLGGSAALPKKPTAPLPRSVGDAGSSAAAVPHPIPRGGHSRQDAGVLRSPEPPHRRKVAAAGGLLDTASQGGSGSGGFGSGKGLVPATTLLPKPTTAIRRLLGPGRGRVTASQPLNKSADERQSNELSTASGSPTHLRDRVASASTMGSINKPDDIADSILQDDCFLSALADFERELKSKFSVSSDVRSDARTKVKMMRERFKFICEATVKFVEQGPLKVGRIDITADIVIKNLPGFTPRHPMIGNVPGVEIGDEFVFRVELALVGLHGPPRGGIGTTKDGSGVLVAVSIVASGRYPDELSSSDELVYTGSGGKLAGKKDDENQKLERGNLGLKNCIETKTPVRVIYGLKRRGENGSHPRAKGASSFIYDGLYHVVSCWKEGQAGAKVFKFKLQRIPGQSQLRYCSKTGIMCGRRSH